MGLRFLASGMGLWSTLLDQLAAHLEMLMVVPPLALGTVWVGKIRVLARAQDALAEANDVAESLANMQTVRTFGTGATKYRYADPAPPSNSQKNGRKPV